MKKTELGRDDFPVQDPETRVGRNLERRRENSRIFNMNEHCRFRMAVIVVATETVCLAWQRILGKAAEFAQFSDSFL